MWIFCLIEYWTKYSFSNSTCVLPGGGFVTIHIYSEVLKIGIVKIRIVKIRIVKIRIVQIRIAKRRIAKIRLLKIRILGADL